MKKYLGIIILLLVFYGCGDDKIKPGIDTSVGEDELPSQESWNSKILFTEEGEIKAILYSDHLRKFDAKKITFLEGVKINFFDTAGVHTSSLTSNKGRVDDQTRDMYAIDNVVAVNDSGVTLKTDELMWVNSTKKIKTDKFVTITTPVETIEGYGFISDQNMRNYTIYNITYAGKPKQD